MSVRCAVLQLLINGEFVDATGGGTFETYDPRTGEVLMSVAEATAQDVDKAVQAARVVSSPRTSRFLGRISPGAACLSYSPSPCCGSKPVAHKVNAGQLLHLLQKGAPQPGPAPQHIEEKKLGQINIRH
jgi:hypothetical protein